MYHLQFIGYVVCLARYGRLRTCVLLPQPVSPATSTHGLEATALTIASWYAAIGREARSRRILTTLARLRRMRKSKNACVIVVVVVVFTCAGVM